MSHDGGTCAGAANVASAIRPLPAEIVSRIISSLVPHIDASASTFPHPTGADFDYTPDLPPSFSSDLVSAASSSVLFHQLAKHVLYRSPLLHTLRSLNLLASTIAADLRQRSAATSGSRPDGLLATCIRSIYLPPGDGLLQPGDTLADQTEYVESLGTIFNCAARLDFVCIEHRQGGAALLEFLDPSTVCRPRRLTLSNLSFSAPPFSTTQSLAPLSKLTHLHLIKIVPPPALISFLVGEPINTDEQGNVPDGIKAGLSPNGSLECLRLSLLPPDALVDFAGYVAWRRAWKEYEQLPARRQAEEPAPRAPRAPARRFAVQEALYDLAVHSANLPRLRLLLLDLSPLGALPSPAEEERETSTHARRRAPPSAMSLQMSNGIGASASPGAHANASRRRKDMSEERAWRSEASVFHNAATTSRAAARRATMAANTAAGYSTSYLFAHGDQGAEAEAEAADAWTREDVRIGERDTYWSHIQAGKHALVQLWRDSSSNMHFEIRVVAARPNGHDRREGFLDFYCQAEHQPIVRDRSMEPTATKAEGGAQDDVGCWADADVFELIEIAPYLSFKTVARSHRVWYWTGELPRETSQPSTKIIPSLIAHPD